MYRLNGGQSFRLGNKGWINSIQKFIYQVNFSRSRKSEFKRSAGELDFDDSSLIFSERKSSHGCGISGAVFNLTTSIIGAGIMALPATMKVLGLFSGVILIIFMGILSEINVELLVKYAVKFKAKIYGEVVEASLGRTARLLSEICIILNNAGALVVYLIIIGDVLSGSIHHSGVFDQWWGHGFWDHRKIVILIVLLVFLVPLCTSDRIDSLSMSSAASVGLAVIFIIVAVVVAFIKFADGQTEIPRLTPDFRSTEATLDLLVVIPVMTNAFVCHFNVLPIYNELKDRSLNKMYRIGRITTLICILINASTAVSGYLLFGENTEPDVLTNFDKDLGIGFGFTLNYIVRIGYIVHLILVFPVIHFSLRQTVNELMFEGLSPLSESRKRCLILTFVLLILVYVGSTMIPNIWVAFKFSGATTAVSLGLTFPSLVALSPSRDGKRRILHRLMLALAIVVSIAGIFGNIYTVEPGSEEKPEQKFER